MISVCNRCLFLHVRKTGGISIKKALQKISCKESDLDNMWRKVENNGNQKPRLFTHHTTLKHYNELLEESFFKSLFKFSIIRNPWERLISLYFSPHRGDVSWNRKEFILLIENENILSNYICLDNLDKSIYFDRNAQLDRDINFLMRYEKIESDFEDIQKILGLQNIKLPFLNKSCRNDYRSYYDDSLIELVRFKFIQEIEFGKYKF